MAKGDGPPRNEQLAILRALTTPVEGPRDWAQIAVTIPKAHLRVLESESELLGLRRGQFLELLFLNRIGQRALTRIAAAPTYKLARDELAETTRFLWYLRREVKGLLDEYLLKLGIRPSALVVTMLNEWAGLGPDVKR
jgi:hypothetical protein